MNLVKDLYFHSFDKKGQRVHQGRITGVTETKVNTRIYNWLVPTFSKRKSFSKIEFTTYCKLYSTYEAWREAGDKLPEGIA